MELTKQTKQTRQIKLYNVIFPVWLILFFPPVILVTLIGNWLIDSLVLIACYFIFKPHKEWYWLLFYKKNIVKVWLLGLLADIIGAAILFACVGFQDFLGLSNDVVNSISFDPFSNFLAFTLIMITMLISVYSFCFLIIIIHSSQQLKTSWHGGKWLPLLQSPPCHGPSFCRQSYFTEQDMFY